MTGEAKIPALPPPPDRSQGSAAVARRRRNQQHQRAKLRKRREQQRQEDCGPRRKTLGLELIADPKLLAKNEYWKEGEERTRVEADSVASASASGGQALQAEPAQPVEGQSPPEAIAKTPAAGSGTGQRSIPKLRSIKLSTRQLHQENQNCEIDTDKDAKPSSGLGTRQRSLPKLRGSNRISTKQQKQDEYSEFSPDKADRQQQQRVEEEDTDRLAEQDDANAKDSDTAALTTATPGLNLQLSTSKDVFERGYAEMDDLDAAVAAVTEGQREKSPPGSMLRIRSSSSLRRLDASRRDTLPGAARDARKDRMQRRLRDQASEREQREQQRKEQNPGHGEEALHEQHKMLRWRSRDEVFGDLDEPFDEKPENNTMQLEGVTDATAESAAARGGNDDGGVVYTMADLETQDYLKSRGLESVRRSRSSRVRNFFATRARDRSTSAGRARSASRGEGRDRSTSAGRFRRRGKRDGGDVDDVGDAALVSESENEVEVVRSSPPLSSADGRVSGFRFKKTRGTKGMKPVVNAEKFEGNGERANSGHSLAVDESVASTPSCAMETLEKVAESFDPTAGQPPSQPVLIDDDEPQPDDEASQPDDEALVTMDQQVKNDGNKGNPNEEIDAGKEAKDQLNNSIEHNGSIESSSIIRDFTLGSIEHNGSIESSSVVHDISLRPKVACSKQLPSPRIVRDRHAKRIVETLREKHKADAKQKQERRKRRQEIEELQQQQQEVLRNQQYERHNGEGAQILLSRSTSTPSPSNLPEPKMRDYFCTPTVSSSMIHTDQPPSILMGACTSSGNASFAPVVQGLPTEGAGDGSMSTPTSVPGVPCKDLSEMTPKVTMKRVVSNESPTGVDSLDDGACEEQARGGTRALEGEPPAPNSPGNETWNSEDTEKTCNTSGEQHPAQARGETILEDVRSQIRAGEDLGKEVDIAEYHISLARQDPLSNDISQPSDGGACTASELFCYDSFNWICNCWGEESQDQGEPPNKDDDVKGIAEKRKKWKEVKEKAAASMISDDEGDEMVQKASKKEGADVDAGKSEHNNMPEKQNNTTATAEPPSDNQETQNEKPLFDATWDLPEKGSFSDQTFARNVFSEDLFGDNAFRDAAAKEVGAAGRGASKPLFNANWDEQPASATPSSSHGSPKRPQSKEMMNKRLSPSRVGVMAGKIMAVAQKIVKNTSGDSQSEASSCSQLSITEEPPKGNPASMIASNVELELDSTHQLLKVMPQAGRRGADDPAIDTATREEDGVGHPQPGGRRPCNHTGAAPGPGDRSYSSLSREAKQLLRSIGGEEFSPSLEEDAEDEDKSPKAQCELQPLELFGDGSQKTISGEKEMEKREKGNSRKSGGTGKGDNSQKKTMSAQSAVISEVTREFNEDDVSKGEVIKKDLIRNDEVDEDSANGTSTNEDNDSLTRDSSMDTSAQGNTLDNSTLTSAITRERERSATPDILDSTQDSTGCNALPVMPTMPPLTMPSLQDGFNNVLDVIDKIDDAINGRMGGGEEESDSNSEESELSELQAKRANRRKNSRRYSSSRSSRQQREQRARRRRRIAKARQHMQRRSRSESPALASDGDDREWARRYQVRFSPGTIVDESDDEGTSEGDGDTLGERSTPTDSRSTPATLDTISDGKSTPDTFGHDDPLPKGDVSEEERDGACQSDENRDAFSELPVIPTDDDSFDNVHSLGASPVKGFSAASVSMQERKEKTESKSPSAGGGLSTRRIGRIGRSLQHKSRSFQPSFGLRRGRSGKSSRSGNEWSAKTSP